MSDQTNVSAAANLANPGSTGSTPDAANTAGQVQNVDWESQYKELETKFGTQGRELGEHREFLTSIAPLLDRLEKSPELVQAILDGKIDANLAKAALEGKLTQAEATAATAAHAEVAADLGTAYQATSPEEIAKLVEAKVTEKLRTIEESNDIREFERKTNEFIEKTADFATYADEIDKWLDEHDVTDIEIAYYAVKGKMSENDAKKAADEAAAEAAKNVVLNAAGGGVQAQFTPDGTPIVDKLISGRPNPNSLF